LFRRRRRKPILQRIREAFYPPGGWGRAIGYYRHRVSRIPDTPHRIALGFSCGVMASFTPFFGFHFFIAAGLAYLLRANVIAGLIGTVAGNPITFPIIASMNLSLGRRILGYGVTGRDFGRVVEAFREAMSGLLQSFAAVFGLAENQFDRVLPLLFELILPWFVGGLLPGLIASIASYYILRPIIRAYQSRRRARMLVRARERMHAAKARADEGGGSA
jgi:uncharacterized protein (DUF2062 family)